MFNQSDKARKASLAWCHLLTHHARVAVSKQKNQAALRYGRGADFRGVLNRRQFLLPKLLEQLKRLVEILFCSTHFVQRIYQTDRNRVNPLRFLGLKNSPFSDWWRIAPHSAIDNPPPFEYESTTMSNDQKSSPAWNVLGLDIGGTEIKAALVNSEGDIITSHRASTPGTLSVFQETIRTLAGHLHLGEVTIRGVGIGCKGIVDPHTTEVLALPGDLNYLEGRRLSEMIAPVVPASCPVAADNDARVALFGEHQWGAARGRQNAMMLTLGTGVGGAVLTDGKILRGAGGVAGHLGHVTVDPNGGLCICGNRGCLETVFSARAIEAEAFAAIHRGVKTQLSDMGSPPSCSDIFECARKGDEVARIVVEHAIFVLGSAIAGLVHIVDPEIVILGGQITQAGAFLLDPIQHEVDRRTRYLLCRKVPIVKAQIAEPSGVVGAAALAIEAATGADSNAGN